MFLPFHILRYQSNKRIRKIYSWAQINFLSAKLNFIYYFQELIREGMDTQFNIYIFWFSKHLEYFSALICCVNLTDNNMTFKDIACNYEILKEMNTSYRASTKGLSTECILRAQNFSVERKKIIVIILQNLIFLSLHHTVYATLITLYFFFRKWIFWIGFFWSFTFCFLRFKRSLPLKSHQLQTSL